MIYPARRESAWTTEIGVVFQQNALFDSLPVWENVAFRLLNRGEVSRQEAREVAREKLGLFGLSSQVGERYPAELSGGMQKRVALARAFAMNPDILILDAPTDGLDPIMTRHTNSLIRRIVQEHQVTVFSIMTEMSSALEFYDDLAMLYDGRIIWNGSTEAARQASESHLRQLLEGRSEGPIGMAVHA
ncbi:ABC transporter ATP-binding protein [Fodinicurvata halophila]|uniref:ABC transporter ATP-binding protein n=1 Tax=Fodinicurvata halophila TaxID=1419723 RepID=UPI003643C9AE